MNIHSGHRARVRKKFIEGNSDSFADYNLLELLLFYSVPRGDVNPLAHSLIDSFGSFSSALDAPYEELLKINGIGESTAVLLKLIPELARRYYRSADESSRILMTTEDVGRMVMPYFIDQECESLVIVCMDRKHKMLYCGRLTSGGLGSVDVLTRDIADIAVRYECEKIVLAHNHPSGVALPSELDSRSTSGIQAVLGSMGVALVDHLIVAGDDFVSMAENGDLPGMEFDYLRELKRDKTRQKGK
jgi:DNA repair protein RadC